MIAFLCQKKNAFSLLPRLRKPMLPVSYPLSGVSRYFLRFCK